MYRVGSRLLPQHMLIDGGSDWFTLHRSFADFLLSDNAFIRDLRSVFVCFFLEVISGLLTIAFPCPNKQLV